MRFRLTHFFPLPIDKRGWIPLPFITRAVGEVEGPYFLGFETERALDVGGIKERELAEEVQRLAFPYNIASGQSVWLAPEGDVWLASAEHPRSDPNRLRIERGPAPAVHEAMSSLGVVDALRGRRLPFLYGDYLNSKRSPGKAYCPEWQSQITLGMAEALRDFSGTQQSSKGTITPRRLSEQEHKYSSIEKLIETGTVLLPYEMIFLNRSRRKKIDVVQLGNVSNLSLVYPIRGNAWRALGLVPDSPCFKASEDWAAAIKDTRTKICVPTGTVADDFIFGEIAQGRIDVELHDERLLVNDIAKWIRSPRNSKDGVVVCDTGIAFRLLQAGARRGSEKLAMSIVPYREPVPVGLAFRAEDRVWGDLLMRCFRGVLKSSNELCQQSLEETRIRAIEVGMTWQLPEILELVPTAEKK